MNQYEIIQKLRAINLSISGKEGNLGKRLSTASPSIVSLEDGVLPPVMQEKLNNIKKILISHKEDSIHPEELVKDVHRISKPTIKKIIKQLCELEHSLEDELINTSFKHSSPGED